LFNAASDSIIIIFVVATVSKIIILVATGGRQYIFFIFETFVSFQETTY